MTKTAFIPNFLKFYNMLWRLILPFLARNRRLRSGFGKRITCLHFSKADIWIQSASAGEAYLAVTLLKNLSPKKKTSILVTATTTQGIDILKTRLSKAVIDKKIDLRIDWFPFDMPGTIKEAIKIITPRIMVLLETELWPALLFFLKKNKTKIFIINARLSQKSFRHYLKTKFLWKHLAPDYILATSDLYAERYRQIFEQACVNTMSNIKFESIEIKMPDAFSSKQIKQLFPQTLPLTVLASIRRQEEKETLQILKTVFKQFPDQIIAIFPRHMHRINAWKKRLISENLTFYLKSKINFSLKGPGIILWDTFGELNSIYGFASVVFVGGSLKPLGGQNFIEPAIAGAVTVTGPYYDDFAWAGEDIFKKQIVINKPGWPAVSNAMITSLETPGSRDHRKQLAQEYFASNQGGTRQACDKILKVFDEFI